MTAKQIYLQALCLLSMDEEEAAELEPMALGAFNQMLADHLYEHNLLSGARISCAPELDSLEDEIPYDEMLVRECFPYGLAALLIADDDHTLFNWLMSEYQQRLSYYAPCVLTDLEEMT